MINVAGKNTLGRLEPGGVVVPEVASCGFVHFSSIDQSSGRLVYFDKIGSKIAEFWAASFWSLSSFVIAACLVRFRPNLVPLLGRIK